jgi:hypothetical protein
MTDAADGVVARKTLDLGPQAFCNSCNMGIGVNFDAVARYLRSESCVCPHCQKGVDWFDLLKWSASFSSTIGFSAIGSTISVIEVEMAPNEEVTVDLDQYIGAGKRLLGVSYMPQGSGVWPIEVCRHVARDEPIARAATEREACVLEL